MLQTPYVFLLLHLHFYDSNIPYPEIIVGKKVVRKLH